MEELKYGTKNKRGDYTPKDPPTPAPVFVWPPRPLMALAWLPSYFLPWNALFFVLGAALWPWATFGDSPVILILVGLLIPLFHEAHFYCIYRLIHIPLLYKWVHSVHHNSVNPSPWSSLSMHPVVATTEQRGRNST